MKHDYSHKLPADWRSTSKVFMALGHEHRHRILLMFEPGEKLNVTQIAEASTLSRTAVVHHLKALHDARILRRRKIGKEVFYWLDAEMLESSLQAVLDYIRTNYTQQKQQ
jgi:DNA-binding transcriptional ArsR family regulator